MQAGCALPGTDQGLISAFPALQKVVPESPAQACVTAARKFERKGQVQLAIEKYEEARRLDPAAPVGHALALLYDRAGDVARAKQEFEQARKKDPKDFELLNDMAYFAFAHGNVSEAEELLRQSLSIKPGNERATMSLGLVLGRVGRYEESYDTFTNILSRDEARTNQQAIVAVTPEGSAAQREAQRLQEHLTLLQQNVARVSPAQNQQE
jgi:Flp pilus assembly protein TadD